MYTNNDVVDDIMMNIEVLSYIFINIFALKLL